MCNFSQMNATEHLWLWDHIGPGNGLVRSSNKPLSEPILAQIFYISTWRHRPQWVNLFKTRQIRRHFADAIFKIILLNESCFISTQISLKFVLGVKLIISLHWSREFGAEPATSHNLNQWCISLVTHICVTRPQWVIFCSNVERCKLCLDTFGMIANELWLSENTFTTVVYFISCTLT